MSTRYSLFLFLLVGVLFGLRPASAQNIQTNSSSTTLGSPTFGFEISPGQLQTVMQMDTAPSTLACGARTNGLMTCNSTGNGSNIAYVKAAGNPGSFTHNPFKQVDPSADIGWFTAFPQTAPNTLDGSGNPLPNTLTGLLISQVDLGISTSTGDPFHSAGHIKFTLNPTSATIGAFGPGTASIDQLILQEINAPGTLLINFSESDSTATPFASSPTPNVVNTAPCVPGTCGNVVGNAFAGLVNLSATLEIDQDGPLFPTTSGFHVESTVNFPHGVWFSPFPNQGCGGPFPCTGQGLTGNRSPAGGEFLTPGLNTGTVNPNSFPNF